MRKGDCAKAGAATATTAAATAQANVNERMDNRRKQPIILKAN